MSIDPPQFSVYLPTEQDTAALAAWFAHRLSIGDTILLHGDVGAGKTHFSRNLIQHRLGRHEDVPSPTFTLVQIYEVDTCEIWHADLYRLSHPNEVIELGLTSAFETGICLVEWPDRLADLAPISAIHLTLSIEGEGRRATFYCAQTHPLLAGLAKEWPVND